MSGQSHAQAVLAQQKCPLGPIVGLDAALKKRILSLPGIYSLSSRTYSTRFTHRIRATGLRDVLNIKKSDFITLHVRLGSAVISCATLQIRLVFPFSVTEMAFVINGSNPLELNSSYAKSKIHYSA